MARPVAGRSAIDWLSLALLVLMHLAVSFVVFVPPTFGLLALALGGYVVRMFAITAGYHRYFSHRSFKTSRSVQFVLALVGTMSMQNGPLWWASWHRRHHKLSDTALDPHSPIHKGFWSAHLGWVISPDEPANRDLSNVKDLAKYPELRFLDRHKWLPLIGYGALTFAIAGWPGLLWGFVISTVLLFHGTLFINSLAHVWGSRRYATPDQSRNNALLAFLTLGEGWHNNHHHYMSTVRQGFYWWEIDVTYYVLKILSWLGIVWDIREPTPAALAGPQEERWGPALPSRGFASRKASAQRLVRAGRAMQDGGGPLYGAARLSFDDCPSVLDCPERAMIDFTLRSRSWRSVGGLQHVRSLLSTIRAVPRRRLTVQRFNHVVGTTNSARWPSLSTVACRSPPPGLESAGSLNVLSHTRHSIDIGMAARPELAILLLAMGIDALSVTPRIIRSSNRRSRTSASSCFGLLSTPCSPRLLRRRWRRCCIGMPAKERRAHRTKRTRRADELRGRGHDRDAQPSRCRSVAYTSGQQHSVPLVQGPTPRWSREAALRSRRAFPDRGDGAEGTFVWSSYCVFRPT